jgi:putative FmdB family regulatory protein
MPIYEYRRPDGSTFEIEQRMSEDALTEDPETGVPVERVLHPVAIHFKGKGFHNTDYGTRRRNRELEKSAKEGADSHDAKTAEKAKEKKDAKAKGSGKEKPASSKKKD